MPVPRKPDRDAALAADYRRGLKQSELRVKYGLSAGRVSQIIHEYGQALDPIHRAYGERSVPRDAVCSSDPISSKLAALLSQTIDMERPDSDGGPVTTLREILAMDEKVLRQCARTLASWVEFVDAYRAGEAPKLRTVA